jgi:hypothetical protein
VPAAVVIVDAGVLAVVIALVNARVVVRVVIEVAVMVSATVTIIVRGAMRVVSSKRPSRESVLSSPNEWPTGVMSWRRWPISI